MFARLVRREPRGAGRVSFGSTTPSSDRPSRRRCCSHDGDRHSDTRTSRIDGSGSRRRRRFARRPTIASAPRTVAVTDVQQLRRAHRARRLRGRPATPSPRRSSSAASYAASAPRPPAQHQCSKPRQAPRRAGAPTPRHAGLAARDLADPGEPGRLGRRARGRRHADAQLVVLAAGGGELGGVDAPARCATAATPGASGSARGVELDRARRSPRRAARASEARPSERSSIARRAGARPARGPPRAAAAGAGSGRRAPRAPPARGPRAPRGPAAEAPERRR